MSNSLGTIFKMTSFGESHGTAIGVVIDGCPAGLTIDVNFIQQQLDKRKPGQSSITTQRKEEDKVQVLSGVFENKSTGAPIALIIYNNDQLTEDYDHLKDAYRPSHADFVYEKKYGVRDYRGGGRSSARVTASCVAAGAVAQLLLKEYGISIYGFVSQVGHINIQKPVTELNFTLTEKNSVRCPDDKVATEMIKYIETIKERGDTIGGTVSCVVKNVPVGLGEPVFDKLHADLGKAMLGINAAHGFDYGAGFEGIPKTGSELNDVFSTDEKGNVTTQSNNSGGIQGGISNGEDIYFRVLFKPVATLMQQQTSINNKSETITLQPKGRHDSCVLPRAVPIVEAMAALVIADHLLIKRSNRL